MSSLHARTFAGLAVLASVSLSFAQSVPEFRLPDVNPNSPRYPAQVSPRDYQLQVSGYYFGAAH